jgi:hypothetical protein
LLSFECEKNNSIIIISKETFADSSLLSKDKRCDKISHCLSNKLQLRSFFRKLSCLVNDLILFKSNQIWCKGIQSFVIFTYFEFFRVKSLVRIISAFCNSFFASIISLIELSCPFCSPQVLATLKFAIAGPVNDCNIKMILKIEIQ